MIMETGDIQLVITIASDCSSVKFKGAAVEGTSPSPDQSALGAVIYAALSHIVTDEETYEFYYTLAKQLDQIERQKSVGRTPSKGKPSLKLVH
jgi:hypothetical protein